MIILHSHHLQPQFKMNYFIYFTIVIIIVIIIAIIIIIIIVIIIIIIIVVVIIIIIIIIIIIMITKITKRNTNKQSSPELKQRKPRMMILSNLRWIYLSYFLFAAYRFVLQTHRYPLYH